MLIRLLIISGLLFSFQCFGQSSDQIMQELEDDTTLNGGDIFSDFNEDLESSQVLEDERFYRYGRFFSVNLGGGITTFTGNRGQAYEDNHPTFHLSTNYFLDFQKAIVAGRILPITYRLNRFEVFFRDRIRALRALRAFVVNHLAPRP